ncbi:Myb-like DNA-binding domain containing protein [Tritrichomonas foetus]|uniref:Myb-like DNA-binding domain containing protein n=1 Tax=Tritrichomonas foetus TaxID=1144522 RepID=A0A1J4JZ28_9EUKA|nr:Myb-like DNA-binding domain containing protein [Tritrichomonas foetus]|eukprot:OHT04409.1 Myb-like DNA-binding domain containing protein [Tritrichomonas foetus]
MYSSYRNIHPRSQFTKVEDEQLKRLVKKYDEDENKWEKIAKEMKNRDSRQCHERWIKYLSPIINHSEWSQEEDILLKKLHSEIGSHWHKMIDKFPQRTEIMLRNRWNILQRKEQKEDKSLDRSLDRFYSSSKKRTLSRKNKIFKTNISQKMLLKKHSPKLLDENETLIDLVFGSMLTTCEENWFEAFGQQL